MTPQAAIKRIITPDVSGMLTNHGFSGKGVTFRRTIEHEVVHRLQLTSDGTSDADVIEFLLEVAVIVPAISNLIGTGNREVPVIVTTAGSIANKFLCWRTLKSRPLPSDDLLAKEIFTIVAEDVLPFLSSIDSVHSVYQRFNTPHESLLGRFAKFEIELAFLVLLNRRNDALKTIERERQIQGHVLSYTERIDRLAVRLGLEGV